MTGTTRSGGGPGSRPHVWPCRHCNMVADYRLNRDAQTQLAEGVFRQDEDYRLTTFKEWLQAFEWDSARERHEQDTAERDGSDAGFADRAADVGDRSTADADPWADHWSARWAESAARAAAAVPAPRTGDHDRPAATDTAEEDVAEAERVARLTRWHTDDDRAHADERGTDDAADLCDRSA
jgi:hypothetical protein